MSYTKYFAIGALCASACVGTETDNPLADFKRTGCKNHGETALTFADDSHAADPLADSSAYDGLYCFDYAFEEEARTIQINVYNYPSACGRVFSAATAQVREGHLTLALEPESCVVARCGSCNYDLAFTVTDFELRSTHTIEVVETVCPTPRETIVSFATSEQDEPESGTLCRTIGEPSACASDGDCKSELEHCVADTCQPRLTF
jgi:hypothetical protein